MLRDVYLLYNWNFQSRVELFSVTKVRTVKTKMSLYSEDDQSGSQILQNSISALHLSPFDANVNYKEKTNQKITALTTANVDDMENREVKNKLNCLYHTTSLSHLHTGLI